MRTVYSVALLALCLTLFAGCAAENDPVGVHALPTDYGVSMSVPEECDCANDDAKCAAEDCCQRECEQEKR